MIRKTDSNHKKLIEQIRQLPSISVFSTHTIGKGFPDIVIGYKGLNYLVEIKDGDKFKSQKKLTDAEEKFHFNWYGQVAIIESFNDVLTLLGL